MTADPRSSRNVVSLGHGHGRLNADGTIIVTFPVAADFGYHIASVEAIHDGTFLVVIYEPNQPTQEKKP